jgi:hypothetical protein
MRYAYCTLRAFFTIASVNVDIVIGPVPVKMALMLNQNADQVTPFHADSIKGLIIALGGAGISASSCMSL